jgi:hypothetical protein
MNLFSHYKKTAMKNLILLFIVFTTTLAFSQKSTKDLLQGKWQSTEDKTNILWFEGNLRKESNDGKNWDSEEFVFSNKCENESDSETGSDSNATFYISCPESDLCWEVTSVTTTSLTLTYTGRGNNLFYKKIK